MQRTPAYLFTVGRGVFSEQCQFGVVSNLCHRNFAGGSYGAAFLPFSGERSRYAVCNGTSPLPYTDIQVHFPPYMGKRRAVSAQNGRYYYGGFSCDMGIGVLSES